jgi:hypothetical protein
MKSIKLGLISAATAMLVLPTASLAALGDPVAQVWVAQIKVSRGIVRIDRAGQRFPGPVGARLKVDDSVISEGNGSVGLTFSDNSTLSMGPDSEVTLKRFEYDPTTHMGAFDAYVKQGTVSLQAGNLADSGPDNLRITTPKSELKGNARQLLISTGESK